MRALPVNTVHFKFNRLPLMAVVFTHFLKIDLFQYLCREKLLYGLANQLEWRGFSHKGTTSLIDIINPSSANYRDKIR
ncbi:hypothetical protein D3C72_745150 [compost metagenome]